MMDLIKKLFGFGTPTDYKALMAQDATIVDVRSKQEYANGHIAGSINIPLDTLTSNLSKINKNKPVITCCASGMRSTSAKSTLTAKGYTSVFNGGGWASLNNKLK